MKNFWNELRPPILALAPMEGITDSAFRSVCRRFGADVVYTEFVSSDAIDHRGRSTLEKLRFTPSEQPVVCQIFGKNPQAFARAAKEIERRGFSGIDINFGCPARKVVGSGAGVALMRNPKYCRTLIESVLGTVSIPLSIKVRTSIRRERREVQPGCAESYTVLDLIEAIRDLPVAAIMVHGRSFEQALTADVDSGMIREAKRRFKGRIIANGGVFEPEDATALLERTGADGIGIARGARGRPWIFSQVKSCIASHAYDRHPPQTLRDIVLEHARAANTADRRSLVEFRKHLAWYSRGLHNASKIRQQLNSVNELEDVWRIVELFPEHTSNIPR